MTLERVFFLIWFVYGVKFEVSNPGLGLGKDFRTWISSKWNLENIKLALNQFIVYNHHKTWFAFLCISDFGTHNILELIFGMFSLKSVDIWCKA